MRIRVSAVEELSHNCNHDRHGHGPQALVTAETLSFNYIYRIRRRNDTFQFKVLQDFFKADRQEIKKKNSVLWSKRSEWKELTPLSNGV